MFAQCADGSTIPQKVTPITALSPEQHLKTCPMTGPARSVAQARKTLNRRIKP